jgi:hypothetical protein
MLDTLVVAGVALILALFCGVLILPPANHPSHQPMGC